MMISVNTTNVLKMILLVTMSLGINGQGAPYGIGFFTSDKSSLSPTCMERFEKVRNYVYPTYYVEVVTDSNVTTTVLDKVTDLYESYIADSYSYSQISISTTNDIGNRRSLLRSSTERKKEIDQKEISDREERKLPSWNPNCIPQCDNRPAAWLISVGCREECGLRRRLDDGSNISSNDVSSVPDAGEERLLTYSYPVGSLTKMLAGQGDTTVSQFYMTVRAVIPFTDPCQKVLLAMTYQIIPLEIKL